MENLTDIRSVEDMNRVLFLQRTITQRTRNEMMQAANSVINGLQDEMTALKVMEVGISLIKKYAENPTLTEFVLQPNMADGARWGATFGVAILVSDLIVEHAKIALPHFAPVMRDVLITILKELENPKCIDLVEPVQKALRMSVKNEDGGALSNEEREHYVHILVHDLVETLTALSERYGLMVCTDSIKITPVGGRVLLHLLDAVLFVEEVSNAHKTLQKVKPKYTMT
jgi:hypothetical protein